MLNDTSVDVLLTFIPFIQQPNASIHVIYVFIMMSMCLA